MPSVFGLYVVTGGLYPSVTQQSTPLVSFGLSNNLPPQLGPNDSSPALIASQNAAISASLGVTIATPATGLIVAGAASTIIGTAATLAVNALESLTSGLGTPQTGIFNPNGAITASYVNNTTTYTGSDLQIIVDLVNAATTAANQQTNRKILVECSTLTVSIHREKAAVRAAGYINPKGFARGRRTIAGTLVLTQFTVDVLYEWLLGQQVLGHDVSKDTQYVKVDQLPPFNMTLLFGDEYGNVSYRRLLGVDFVTDGVVYSTNDMLSEQTISYMAADFTPLLNINDSAQYQASVMSQSVKSERTPGSVFLNTPPIPATNIFSS